jgi:H+/Cl- antiporter ClcA
VRPPPLRCARAWVGQASYWPKWLVLGPVIGLAAGWFAVAFRQALGLATRVLSGTLAGYTPAAPVGDGGGPGTGHIPHLWLIPVIVCLGGLVSGMLNAWLAPRAASRGLDATIEAVHTDPRRISSRAVVAEFASSAITIGSGGSGGRGGAAARISAGFGSLLARALDLTSEDSKIAVCAGIGSGFAAIFGAPLGGAAMAAEITYLDGFQPAVIFPGLMASVTSSAIFGLVEGFTPLFGHMGASYTFGDPLQVAFMAIVGAMAGLMGLIYATTFRGVTALAERIPGSRVIRPAIGGLLVGLIALRLPQVMGTGNGWIQDALDRAQLMHLPLWLILALPLGKIVATALSIGTGGSGGLVGPGMVTGAFVGAATWRILGSLATGVPHDPAPFVMVGMMSCIGSIARAPIAVMLMVAEMTGSAVILVPAMIAVGIAYCIVSQAGQTIFASQVHVRGGGGGGRRQKRA